MVEEEDFPSSTSPTPPPRKRAKTSSTDLPTYDKAAFEGDGDDDEDPDGLFRAPPRDALRTIIRSYGPPSMVPTGPNGSWVCDEEECGFVVRDAEEQAGIARIQQHIQSHESQAQGSDLGVTEGRHGFVPIKYAYFPRFSSTSLLLFIGPRYLTIVFAIQ
jgi:hypothetical protein